ESGPRDPGGRAAVPPEGVVYAGGSRRGPFLESAGLRFGRPAGKCGKKSPSTPPNYNIYNNLQPFSSLEVEQKRPDNRRIQAHSFRSAEKPTRTVNLARVSKALSGRICDFRPVWVPC